MKLKPSKRKTGAGWQALCDWARDNDPLLAFRSSEEIEKLVRAAWTETRGLRIVISGLVAVVAVFVTWRVTADFFGPSPTEWQSVATSVLVAAAIAIIVRFIDHLIVHREISRLTRATYGRPSHE